MESLFENNGAEFSVGNKYRYALWRIWDEKLPLVMIVGLNPSTANQTTDDATIRRVKRFSYDWGYGGFYMMNLFALVTPYPEELKKSDNPLGDNNGWLEKIHPKCEKVIFAWGAFKEAHERSIEVINMFPDAYCLGKTKSGCPKHPLYLKSDTIPILFREN